ncbi:hypothetical protein GCM10027423_43560 [Spirosoma arcticum]
MNRPWLTGLLVLAMTFPVVAQMTDNPGMLLDDQAYEQLPYPGVVYKEKIPSRISYEPFCPAVRAQGTYSTCVGFACGYYFRTIIEAKTRQITDKTAIGQLAFSPSYLYEKAKTGGDYACTQGVYLSKALDVLRGTGAVPVNRFPYPACSQKTDGFDAVAAQYRIGAYERLFSVGDDAQKKIANLRRALASGSPVVIGMVVPASFYSAGRVWKPNRSENPLSNELRGHAVCLIGYDDGRYGGSFRVVNSFGSAWADGGFCWIRYRDLARFTRYGYAISPP